MIQKVKIDNKKRILGQKAYKDDKPNYWELTDINYQVQEVDTLEDVDDFDITIERQENLMFIWSARVSSIDAKETYRIILYFSVYIDDSLVGYIAFSNDPSTNYKRTTTMHSVEELEAGTYNISLKADQYMSPTPPTNDDLGIINDGRLSIINLVSL